MEVNQEKKWCVYKHTNKINGKVYIGQTGQEVNKRWKNGAGYVESAYFYSAIQKNGWDNFEHEILKNNLTKEEANELEIYYIKFYNSNNTNFGYNLTAGGDVNILSEESRKKLSNSLKGRKLSEESRQKISESLSEENHPNWGKHLTEETRRKISENMKGEKNYFYGKSHTEEFKEKVSKKLKGHVVLDEVRAKTGKPVKCIETSEIYFGIREAGRKLNMSPNGIGACCRGQQKTAKGYHWEYVDTNSEEYKIYLESLINKENQE